MRNRAAAEPFGRGAQKACLERYRSASREIIAVLHKTAPAAVLEKASIDEVYMDVTAIVDNELQASSHRSRAAFVVTRTRRALARRPGQSAAP